MIPAASALPWLFAACQDPAAGTFVGNPTMTAHLAEAPGLPVIDGLVVASEVRLGGCGGGDDFPLGPRTLWFDGPWSPQVLQIPSGPHCGVFFALEGFTLRFDEGAPEATTVVADAFDLRIDSRFDTRFGTRHAVRFGDDAWLAALAVAAEPGENRIDGSDPALDEAFFAGLEAGSDVDGWALTTPTTLPEDLAGRVDIETWPTSPLGTPTRFGTRCGPGVNYDLAVPIPPAAMQAAGLADGDVGWCEANVLFAADPTPQTATQTDYRDGSTYEVDYNGWSQGCGTLHCGALYSAAGEPLGRPCTALALCGASGEAVVTGFDW